jgi:glutamate racemase
MAASDLPDSTHPIGVFDSGIGGLTVVGAIRRLLPHEKIFYIGDTARVPYGGKSPATVERYSVEIGSMLVAEHCKLIVIACNTASSVAVPKMKAAMPRPVLGVIEPGARAAVEATRNGHVGVIGTRATIKSGAYERAICAIRQNVAVTSRACPLLVPLIEEGLFDGDVTERVISDYVRPMIDAGVDTLVLGCTHYPLLREAIQRVAGDDVVLVDSAENCARAVKSLLSDNNIAAAENSSGSLRVALTDMPDHFLAVAQNALKLEISDLGVCEIPSAQAR